MNVLSTNAVAKKQTVLVVDDEDDLRDLLCYLFESKGYRTIGANSAKTAFEIIASETVDLVISDMRMPGGGGIELIEKVHRFDLAPPLFIFVTGLIDISLEEAYKMGVHALFAKPFDNKVLMSTAKEALDQRRRWPTRKNYRHSVSLEIQIGSKRLRPTFSQIDNLDLLGMFVGSDCSTVSVGEVVDFEIKSCGNFSFPVRGSGVVKWVRDQGLEQNPKGFGVEFANLSDESKRRLIELVNYLKTQQELR